MKDAGSALMGIGFATGENRAREAAERALRSPLIDTEIPGARGILLSIAGGDDLSLLRGQRGGRGRPRGRDRRHEHHLRRDDRRAAHRPGLGHGGRDRARRGDRPARTPSATTARARIVLEPPSFLRTRRLERSSAPLRRPRPGARVRPRP